MVLMLKKWALAPLSSSARDRPGVVWRWRQRAAVCLVPVGRGRLSHAREGRASRSVGNCHSALERGRARGGLDGRLAFPIRNGAVAVRHPAAAAVRRTVVR